MGSNSPIVIRYCPFAYPPLKNQLIDQILHAIEDGAVSYKLKYAVPEPKLSLGKKLTNLLKLE